MLTSCQHDAVLDYYGRRLATCSSDRTVKIFVVDGETHKLTETLKGYVTPPRKDHLFPSPLPPLSPILSLPPSPPSPSSPTPLTPPQPRRRRLVRLLGAPQIRQHPRLSRLRRQSLHLARIELHLVARLRLRPPHRLREHHLLVAPRIRVPTRLRQLRRQRLRPRIQG